MAKTTTLAAVFLCLFAAALARVEPITDDTTSTAVSLPIAEVDTTSTELVNGETQSKSEITATVTPVINYHFNPIKRRFRVRSKFPCHHGRHTERKEISYGNDMLVANPSENSDLPKPETERNPWNWMKLHHHHEAESDSDSDSDDEGAEIERKSWMKLYHHHHHHEAESDSDSDDEGEGKKVFTRRDWTDQVVSDGKSEIKEAVPFHHHRHHHHRRHREEKKGGFMKLVIDFVHNHF